MGVCLKQKFGDIPASELIWISPDFCFHDQSHTYWYQKIRAISATQILTMVGAVDNRFYTEESRERGKAVHLAAHFRIKKIIDPRNPGLDWRTVDKDHLGYLMADIDCLNSLKIKIIASETPLFNPLYRYATTPDVIFENSPKDFGLVERKTGKMQKWTAIQTAFQAMALWPKNYHQARRIGMELREDGTYKTENFTDPSDFNVATGMVISAQWIFKNGGRRYDLDERSDSDGESEGRRAA